MTYVGENPFDCISALLQQAREGAHIMTDKGTFRIRKTDGGYVVEELRWGLWMIIEDLTSLEAAEDALNEYDQDGHTINWHI